MKKTKYFISQRFDWSKQMDSLNVVVELRDKFLESQKDTIATIDSENVTFTTLQQGSQIFATLTLSYYEK